eukprot:6179553-Pleurochrysis_carterae.AAC.2
MGGSRSAARQVRSAMRVRVIQTRGGAERVALCRCTRGAAQGTNLRMRTASLVCKTVHLNVACDT